MKKRYQTEMRQEIDRYAHLINPEDLFTEADIAHLPAPVQRYFDYCGYIGKPKMVNAEVVWSESAIKLAVGRPWMKLQTYQFNSVPVPFRIAYMRTTIGGIVPFEGRDIYRAGQGNMLGKLMNLIPLFDSKGAQLSQSAIITLFAEVLFIPNYALQPYITWEVVDDTTAKARLQHDGFDVCGMFYFDADGKFTRFYTQDRYMALPKGVYEKVPFSIDVMAYCNHDNILFPSRVSARWHLESGDHEYYIGTVSHMRYNLK